VSDKDESYDLALAAASLRSNNSDIHLLLKALCAQLADALNERLVVRRGRGLVRKSEVITGVTISMGDEQFEASVEGSSLRCSIGHLSGGIRIRSENPGVDEWVTKLLGALRDEAAHSDTARRALENLVIGGHQ